MNATTDLSYDAAAGYLGVVRKKTPSPSTLTKAFSRRQALREKKKQAGPNIPPLSSLLRDTSPSEPWRKYFHGFKLSTFRPLSIWYPPPTGDRPSRSNLRVLIITNTWLLQRQVKRITENKSRLEKRSRRVEILKVKSEVRKSARVQQAVCKFSEIGCW